VWPEAVNHPNAGFSLNGLSSVPFTLLASNDDSDKVLAFYTPGIGLLDADWLQRVSCRALIGWSLQRVTSLRHAIAAKVLLLRSAFCGLLHSP